MSANEVGFSCRSLRPFLFMQMADLPVAAIASCSRDSQRFRTAKARGLFRRLVRRVLYLRWAVSLSCEAVLADRKGGL